MQWSLHPPAKSPLPQTGGWVGLRAYLDAVSREKSLAFAQNQMLDNPIPCSYNDQAIPAPLFDSASKNQQHM